MGTQARPVWLLPVWCRNSNFVPVKASTKSNCSRLRELTFLTSPQPFGTDSLARPLGSCRPHRRSRTSIPQSCQARTRSSDRRSLRKMGMRRGNLISGEERRRMGGTAGARNGDGCAEICVFARLVEPLCDYISSQTLGVCRPTMWPSPLLIESSDQAYPTRRTRRRL